jgi:iron complex transport system ATP-binding protein
MNDSVLLSEKDLTVGYADGNNQNILFENLDIDLRAGELVCFMGPNGIGKSTLIRTLAGLQPRIDLTPNPLSRGEGASPAKLSVVLTDRISAVNMTVQELVTYGRYPYLDWNIKLNSQDVTMIERAIELTHIQYLVGKKLYELSDGQLQMAMIARALAQNTPVILLDEPTAHLDLNNRVEIMNLLRKLSRTEGKAILVATHELDLALQTADLVWLAGRNKKIITGIPEDLVLNGSFDELFQFKGFDLKTGKVFHENFRNISVSLSGEGHEYLWTKNALERNGYEVTETGTTKIKIEKSVESLLWVIDDYKKCSSITDLLHEMNG